MLVLWRQVTHLFRDVLHGWGQILLCVNVSPAACDYDETARVLRYAALATQIGTAARAEPPLRVLKCAHLFTDWHPMFLIMLPGLHVSSLHTCDALHTQCIMICRTIVVKKRCQMAAQSALLLGVFRVRHARTTSSK